MLAYAILLPFQSLSFYACTSYGFQVNHVSKLSKLGHLLFLLLCLHLSLVIRLIIHRCWMLICILTLILTLVWNALFIQVWSIVHQRLSLKVHGFRCVTIHAIAVIQTFSFLRICHVQHTSFALDFKNIIFSKVNNRREVLFAVCLLSDAECVGHSYKNKTMSSFSEFCLGFRLLDSVRL